MEDADRAKTGGNVGIFKSFFRVLFPLSISFYGFPNLQKSTFDAFSPQFRLSVHAGSPSSDLQVESFTFSSFHPFNQLWIIWICERGSSSDPSWCVEHSQTVPDSSPSDLPATLTFPLSSRNCFLGFTRQPIRSRWRRGGWVDRQRITLNSRCRMIHPWNLLAKSVPVDGSFSFHHLNGSFSR